MASTSAAAAKNGAVGGKGGGLTYAAAGVDLHEKDTFTDSIVSIMRRTHGPRVIQNPGGFAGLFRLDFNQKLFRRNYKDPVLVACTDGCGTKVKLASEVGRYDTIGIDLVAMNVNDMVVQGAEPLFFLDYIAVSKVDSKMLTDVVRGVAEGCKLSGCALIGGETAEMPDVYAPGEFDLAGFAVGVVELSKATDAERVEPGDIVLGLTSSGVHSNGYSLVRRIVKDAGLGMGEVYPELGTPTLRGGRTRGGATSAKHKNPPRSGGVPKGKTLGEVLLTPTRIYAESITKLLRQYKVKKVITGMAHITGSGMSGNLCRALHSKVDAVVDRSSWPMPPLFAFLQKHGRVDTEEMYRVFNMGVGYTLIVRPAFAESVKERLEKLGETVYVIGKVVKGKGEVKEIG
ncbi:MAG TPA: phosphoribosylformylglycinamidine cyclo-ligase [Phycisphaerales bacterium]|nr:phosphoribosylformylglycinamidine cyclo-ligase [Phycisphaerales bacterium]